MPLARLRTSRIAATSRSPSITPTRSEPAPAASPEFSAHSHVWHRWPVGVAAINSFHRRRSAISFASTLPNALSTACTRPLLFESAASVAVYQSGHGTATPPGFSCYGRPLRNARGSPHCVSRFPLRWMMLALYLHVVPPRTVSALHQSISVAVLEGHLPC